MNADWILEAIDVIKSGIANKLVKDNISVYKVGDNIRIDISGAMKDKGVTDENNRQDWFNVSNRILLYERREKKMSEIGVSKQ